MLFDVDGARKAGYSDGEIASFLGKQTGFDVDGAIKAGYQPAEIVAHLSERPAKAAGPDLALTPTSSQPAKANITARITDSTQPSGAELAAREGSRLRDLAFTGVDQGIASAKNLGAAVQLNRLQQTQAQIRDLESKGRGDSIAARQLRAEVESLQSRLPRTFGAAAEAQASADRGSAMTQPEVAKRIAAAKTWEEGWNAFKDDPYTAISSVTASSLPLMLPALLVGAVGGVAPGAVALGVSSGAMEAGSAIAEFAREAGVDTGDGSAVQAFYSDPRNLAAGLEYAGRRAGVIGSMDALSGGIAGKVLAPAVRSAIARQAINIPAQAVVQGAAGAAGEAGAQLATKGEIDQPGQVLLEAAGELGGAPAEVATFGRDAARAAASPPAPDQPSAEQMALDRGFLRPTAPAAAPTAAPAPTPTAAPTRAPAAPNAAIITAPTIDAAIEAASQAVSAPVAAPAAPVAPPATALAPEIAAATDSIQQLEAEAQPATAAGSFESILNETGTLSILGEVRAITKMLKDAGVTAFVPSKNGVLVGRSAADAAQQALADFLPVQRVTAPAQTNPTPIASTFGAEPAQVWTGRRGSGYLSETDASMALPSRQRMFPELQWGVEPMAGGQGFRLAGYAQPAAQMPAPAPVASIAPAPAATVPTPAAPNLSPVEPAALAVDATPDPVAQRAAHAKAEKTRKDRASRLRSAAFDKNPLMAFVAKHGLSLDLANEFAPGKTERRRAIVPGYGPVFRRAGLNVDLLAQRAAEEGFLPPGSQDADALYEMIARAFRGERVIPMYAEGAAEQEIEARIAARFDDYADAFAGDPTIPDLDPQALGNSGYDSLSPEEQAEFAALIQAAEDEGIDTEAILEYHAKTDENRTDDEYRQAVRTDIEAARAKRAGSDRGARPEQGRAAPEPEGAARGESVSGQQGAARSGREDQVAAPTPVQTPAAAGVSVSGFEFERNASGTLSVSGEPDAAAKWLTDRGVTQFAKARNGVLVGKRESDKAEKLLKKAQGKPAPAPKEARPLALGTTPGDAEAVTVKDGIVYVGKYEALDFDSGEPVRVPEGATDAQVKQALKDAGVLGGKQKFFGGAKDASDAFDSPMLAMSDEDLTAPTKEDVLAQQARAQEAERTEAKRRRDEAQKAAADSQRNDFTLTGSDRAADANPGQGTLFARGGVSPSSAKRPGLPAGLNVTAREGMATVEQARKIVDSLTAKWKNPPKKVHVVATARDLPIEAPSDARGLYMGGEVWVVAGAHQDTSTLRSSIAKTLAHEAVAHHGLRDMLGRDDWNRLMKQVQLALDTGNKPLGEIRAYVRRAYVDEAGNYMLNPAQESDEVAARAVEQAIDENGELRPGFGFLKAVYAKIAEFLRSIGIDVKFTNAELQGILVLSMRNLEGGKRTQGGGQQLVAAAREEARLLRVFHGSPHEFDAFDLGAIGTGEGAQVYGWGLYFAGRKEVAEHYRRTLAGSRRSIAYGPVEAMRRQFAGDTRYDIVPDTGPLGDGNAFVYKTPGRLYEVEIPDEGAYLLWDKPLDEQPKKVREAVYGAATSQWMNYGGTRSYVETPKAWMTGNAAYARLSLLLGGDEAASRALAAAGVPGIKYLDGASRNRPLNQLKREFLDQLPEDAGFDEVMDLIGTGTFSPANEAILKALKADDWLGFDYPAQAISAAFSGQLANYDASPALVQAVTDAQEGGTFNYVVFDDKAVKIEARFARGDGKDQTETEAFKRWFGDSKVVDADGKPLVVYHGTTKDFDAFRDDWGRDRTVAQRIARAVGVGRDSGDFFFASDPEFAGAYAGQQGALGGGNVMPVYLSIRNPAEWSAGAGLSLAEFMRQAKRDGRDGVVVRGWNEPWLTREPGKTGSMPSTDVFIAFDARQIKSAIGNRGTFDPNDADIRFARGTPAGNAATGPSPWETPEPTKLDRFIFEAQDGRIDLKRVTEAIRAAGRDLQEKFDARMAETLYPGRVAYRTQRFLESEVRPLMEFMAGNRIKIEEIGDYLLARHAPERNEQIASINDALPDGGAGRNSAGDLMTTKAANDYIAAIPRDRRKVLERAAARIDQITAGTRALLVAEGLEKPETIKAWEDAYEFYAPLFKDEAQAGSPHPIGTGFTVKGSASKRATGSTKQVTDILGHVLMQREAAITRAEKNRVGLSLYGMALAHPNDEFWTTIRPDMSEKALRARLTAMGVDADEAMASMQGVPTIRSVDAKTGKVVDRPNPIYKSLPGAIVVKVAGEDRVLMLNVKDERALRLVESLKNLDGLTTLDLANNIVGKATRWLAAVNTAYNPIFGLVNVIRDAQSAALNLSTTELKGKSGEVLGNMPAAFIGIARDLRNDSKRTPWSDLWREFQEAGGRTGWREMFRDAKDRTTAIEKELSTLQTEGRLTVGKATHAVLDLLDDFNSTLENAVRLSAYKSGLDIGMSKSAAARMARELTVDFNRKGRTGRELSPLYAFLNASAQGTARMLESLKGPAGAKIIAGGFALGAIQAVMLAAAGFDDDDIPEWTKARNLIIPTGWRSHSKTYITIPMALGFNVLPNTGRVVTELALSGGKDFGKKVGQAIGEMVSSFNPFGGGDLSTLDGWAKMAAPTLADPAIEIIANRNFAGGQIERRPFREEGDNRPGFARARESTTRSATGQVYIGISQALNELTGGSAYEAGKLSPTPEAVRYFATVMGGGVLREFEKGVNASVDLARGVPVKPGGIPLTGRFFGEVDADAVETKRFFEAKNKINKANSSLKAAEKAGDSQEYRKILLATPQLAHYKHLQETQRSISALNKMATETASDPDRLARLDAERTRLMKSLNDSIRQQEGASPTPADRLRALAN